MRSNPPSVTDVVLALVLAMAGAVVIGGGAVVELAGLFAGRGAPPVSVSSLESGIFEWHSHPGDPKLAFPGPTASRLPGPVGMYTAVAVVAAVCLLGAALIWKLRRRLQVGSDHSRAQRHRDGLAGPRTLARLFPAGVAGGLTVAIPLPKGRPIVVAHERSVGALMAPRTGKSSSAVCHVLDAPGAVLATSSKRELLLATAANREASTREPTLVFDPMGFCGWDHPIRWSPVGGCDRPEVAMRRAEALMAGTSTDNVTNGGFWKAAATMLLRCVLHACALEGANVSELRRWVADPDDPSLVEVLRGSPVARAWLHDLALMTRQHGETVESVALTTAVALDCLALPTVAEMCSPRREEAFDAKDWLARGGTVHVVAPAAESASVAPLTAAFVDDVVVAARALAMSRPDGRLDPPFRLVLDELPNICPLPQVDSYLADGGGRGIQICWYAQARSQLVGCFGREKASTILGATSVMLYGGGLHDPELLKDLSTMLGQVEVRTQTRNTAGSGVTSWSEQIRHVPTMEPAEIYRLAQFEALLMAGGTGGGLVRVVPWWERPDADTIRTGTREALQRCSLPGAA